MFKIGDRVEYVGNPDYKSGSWEGVVTAVSERFDFVVVDWGTHETALYFHDVRRYGWQYAIQQWEQARNHARTLDVDSWQVPAVVGQTARVLERVGEKLFPVERGER
jgi:hypothetical protein